jgi:two-component system, NarL family, invasion response regulator UvrY
VYGVLIADDHPLVRAGFRQFLQADPQIGRIGEASTAEQALAMSREEHWDLVLLDIGLPGRSGLDILGEIIDADSDSKVLITSGLSERQFAVHALRLGADGYLSKRNAPEELMNAIHTVLAGGEYISAGLAETLVAERQQKRDAPLHQQLSVREFQIFCKLAVGRSTTSMARELGLSSKTVSTYRQRIFHKMKFHANADLVTYAIRNNLIPNMMTEHAVAVEKPYEEHTGSEPSQLESGDGRSSRAS